jgi:hypothetical protein
MSTEQHRFRDPAMRNVAPENPFLWTRGAAALQTLGYLERRGIDAEPILSEAGLSRGQLAPSSCPHRFSKKLI